MSIFGKPNINKLKEQKDTDGLIKALSHKDYTVRYAAAEALSQLSDSRVVGSLIASIRSDMDGAFDAALVNIGAPAVEALITALADGFNRDIIYALGKIGDPRAVDALIAALDLKDGYHSDIIINALGEAGDSRAIEALIAGLEFNDYSDNKACIYALGHFDDPRAMDALIKILPFRGSRNGELATKVLVELGNPAVKYLSTALQNRETRQDAIQVLEKIDTPEARKALANDRQPNQDSGPELLDDQYKKKINNLIYEPKQTERELIAIGRPVVPSLIAAIDHFQHWINRSEEQQKAFPESEHFDWQVSAYQWALSSTLLALKEITGQNFSESSRAWKKWWEQEK